MGIGEAIAHALAKEGANLILFSRSEVRRCLICMLYHPDEKRAGQATGHHKHSS